MSSILLTPPALEPVSLAEAKAFQFANAELTAPNTYKLSRLLRGQLGTEWAMADVLAAGAPFALLDRAVVPFARGLETLERPQQLRLVASGRDTSDPANLPIEITPHATALKPLSPVHLKARRDAAGVTFSWIRRTRRGATAGRAKFRLARSGKPTSST